MGGPGEGEGARPAAVIRARSVAAGARLTSCSSHEALALRHRLHLSSKLQYFDTKPLSAMFYTNSKLHNMCSVSFVQVFSEQLQHYASF